MTSHDYDLTFTDIFWPYDLKNNNKNYHNCKEDRHVAYHMKAKDKSIFDLGYLYFLTLLQRLPLGLELEIF